MRINEQSAARDALRHALRTVDAEACRTAILDTIDSIPGRAGLSCMDLISPQVLTGVRLIESEEIVQDLVAAVKALCGDAPQAAYIAFAAEQFPLAIALARVTGLDDEARAILTGVAAGPTSTRATWAVGALLESGASAAVLEPAVRQAANSSDPEVVRTCLRVCGAYEAFATLLKRQAARVLETRAESELHGAAAEVLGHLATLPEAAASVLREILYRPGVQRPSPLVLHGLLRGRGGCAFLVSECVAGRLSADGLAEIVEESQGEIPPAGRDPVLRVLRERREVAWTVILVDEWARDGWYSPECDRCLLAALASAPDVQALTLDKVSTPRVVNSCGEAVLRRCWELAAGGQPLLTAARATRALAGLRAPWEGLGRAVETTLPRASGKALVLLLEAASRLWAAGGSVGIPIETYVESDDEDVHLSAIEAASWCKPDVALDSMVKRVASGRALDGREIHVLVRLAHAGFRREQCLGLLEACARLDVRSDVQLEVAEALADLDVDSTQTRVAVERVLDMLDRSDFGMAAERYYESVLTMLLKMSARPPEMLSRCERALRGDMGVSTSAYGLLLRERRR